MQHTRAICYYIASSNRSPNSSFPTIQQFWPLPFDDEETGNEESEAKRLQKIMEDFKQGKYGQRGT
jgi:hypothetical protein